VRSAVSCISSSVAEANSAVVEGASSVPQHHSAADPGREDVSSIDSAVGESASSVSKFHSHAEFEKTTDETI